MMEDSSLPFIKIVNNHNITLLNIKIAMKKFQCLTAEESRKGRENNFLQIRKEKKMEYSGIRRAHVEPDPIELLANQAKREADQQEILSDQIILENSIKMKTGTDAQQKEALQFYRQKLSRPISKENELMDALLVDDIIPRICSFLIRTDSPSSQVEAVWCITNLACGSPQVLDALHRLDVASVLVDILASIPSSHSDKLKMELRDHCLWALSNLCAVKEDIRQVVIKKDVVSLVLEDLGLKVCTTGRVKSDLNPSLISLRYMAWLLCNIGKSLQYQYLDCLPSIIEALAFFVQLEDTNILMDVFRFIAVYCLESSNEGIVNTSIERMLEYGIFSRIMLVLHKAPYHDSRKLISHFVSDEILPLARTNDLRFFAIRALSKALILGDIRQKCGLIVASRTLDVSPLQMQLAADAEYYTWYRLKFADREDQINYFDDPTSRNKLNGTVQGTVIAVGVGEYLTNSTPLTILRDLDATIISIFKAIRAINQIDDQFISSLMEIPSILAPDTSQGQMIFQCIIQILQRGLSSNMKAATSFILCQFLSADDLLRALCDSMCSASDPRVIANHMRSSLTEALNTNDIEVLTAVLMSANKVLNYFARIGIKWIDDEFLDKISFFIHYKNPKIQRAAGELHASIDRLEDFI